MKEISIKEDFIKLDQFLKYIGVTSTGGESKILIKSDKIKLNGEKENRRGKKLRIGDVLEIEGLDEKVIIK